MNIMREELSGRISSLYHCVPDDEDYDAILGNREVRGDGKSRKFIEKTLCFILKVIFKVKLKDANAPFRLMKSDLVKKYISRFDEQIQRKEGIGEFYDKYFGAYK